jgi:16S rRNA (cytidine1402-2'-O)-methyltransferase
MKERYGILYVVATPIGNLHDMSERAISVLENVDVIACEDTRRCRKLLSAFNIQATNLISLHEHNEENVTSRVLDLIAEGRDVALVSDAGTPLICDPGFDLIRALWKRKFHVIPVPGPSAITTILSVAPIPNHDFRFAGFIPARARAREDRLKQLLIDGSSVLFFETARRLSNTLDALCKLEANRRQIFIARELTKIHESLYFGSVEGVRDEIASNEQVRGEIVCLLGGTTKVLRADVDLTLQILLAELAPTQAARLAAKITGETRARAYNRALVLSSNG